MGADRQKKVAVVESRWISWRKAYPRAGEVFVARRNDEVFPELWVMGEEFGNVQYYRDPSTVLGGVAGDIFTHWLPVGEVI